MWVNDPWENHSQSLGLSEVIYHPKSLNCLGCCHRLTFAHKMVLKSDEICQRTTQRPSKSPWTALGDERHKRATGCRRFLLLLGSNVFVLVFLMLIPDLNYVATSVISMGTFAASRKTTCFQRVQKPCDKNPVCYAIMICGCFFLSSSEDSESQPFFPRPANLLLK